MGQGLAVERLPGDGEADGSPGIGRTVSRRQRRPAPVPKEELFARYLEELVGEGQTILWENAGLRRRLKGLTEDPAE